MLSGKQYSPVDYAAMALRWRWIIVASVFVCGYSALLVSSRLPDSFQSEMLIQVIPQQVPASFVQSTVTMRTVDRLSALQDQIMSRTELERLIADMNLYPERRTQEPLQDVVEHMRNQLKVDPVRAGMDRDADSFYIRFSYSDPQTARRVTERLGSLFIDVNRHDRGQLAQSTERFLQQALTEARQKLEQTEERLRRFREANAGRLPTQLSYNMQALQGEQARVQALVDSLARDRDRKQLLGRMYADAQAEVIAPPVPVAAQAVPPQAATTGQPGNAAIGGTMAQQLAAARQQLIAFELRLKPEHPDVITTKALIARLETQLADETKRAQEARATGERVSDPLAAVIDEREAARQTRLKDMAAELDTLDRTIARKEQEETQIRASMTELQRRIEQVPGVESEWISLTRDYETQSVAYKELLSKRGNAQLAANLEDGQIGEQFKILDPARTPVRPTGINRLMVNAGGAVVGLMLGLLLAGVLELRDRTFHQPQDVVEVLKLPVIALVPQVMTSVDERRRQWRTRLVTLATSLVVVAAGYGFWALELWKYVV